MAYLGNGNMARRKEFGSRGSRHGIDLSLRATGWRLGLEAQSAEPVARIVLDRYVLGCSR
jgi:hypothetical protein